jgi:1-acyl-sn-glycerol-3-phosphate acyltransferase
MKSYQRNVDKIADRVTRFFTKTFEEIVVTAPPGLERELSRGPLMLAATHRSHTDYFLLGYVFYKMGLKHIRYAAGDNLTSLPYIGPLFMSLGAFTVERNRSRDRSYIAKLPDQVAAMLLQGESVLVFPEGGRSYRGGMMDVQQVVIGGAVLAQARDDSRDFRYLPCAISYEKLPELPYFGVLQEGRRLRGNGSGSIGKLWGNVLYFGSDAFAFAKFLTAHYFGGRFGRVWVDIGEPLAVREVVDLTANYNPRAPNEFWAHRPSAKIIAAEIHKRFLALYRLLPQHVVACVVKDGGSDGVAVSEAAVRAEALVADLSLRGRNTRSLGMDPLSLVNTGISQLSVRKAVAVVDGRIRITDSSAVDYYAAACGDGRGAENGRSVKTEPPGR